MSQLSSQVSILQNYMRQSRIDQSRKESHIPRPSGDLAGRISGVRPFDNMPPSASRSVSRPLGGSIRHHSAEPNRRTLGPVKPRPHSAQRSNIQNRQQVSMNSYYETPLSKTRGSSNFLPTPMSAVSISSQRMSRARTPSNEQKRTYQRFIEKALAPALHKDKRTGNNHAWQKETEARIMSRLQEDSNFCYKIPNVSSPLRPITIRFFLEITNYFLLKCGGIGFEVDPNNYVQKLPEIAQKMSYAGAMTKSWLKSLSAMHSFQSVLEFLSYLIDYADNMDFIEQTYSCDKLYGSDQNGEFLLLRYEHYLETWALFQMCVNFDAATETYIEQLKRLHNISDEDCKVNENKLNELKKTLCEKMAYVDKFKQKYEELEHDYAKSHNRLNCLKDLQVQLSEESAASESNKEKINERLISIKKNAIEFENLKRELNEQLSSQKMTIADRDSIIKEVEFLNEVINSNRELIQQMEKVLFQKDIELVSEQNKALKCSISVNRLLMTVGLAIGKDLSSYSLMQRELLSEETPDNIKKTCDILKESIAETEKQLHDVQQQKHSQESHLQRIKVDSEKLQDRVKNLETAIHNIEEQIELEKSKLSTAKHDKENLNARKVSMQDAKIHREKKMLAVNQETAFWEEQDATWRTKLDVLRGEEQAVREDCKKRAEAVIRECHCIVRELQPLMTVDDGCDGQVME